LLADRKGIRPVKKLVPIIPKGYVPEELAEETEWELASPGVLGKRAVLSRIGDTVTPVRKPCSMKTF